MRRLERRLVTACDTMRLGGRCQDARDCELRWRQWLRQRCRLPAALAKRERGERALAKREERKRLRRNACDRRSHKLRIERSLAADATPWQQWRSNLRAAAKAAPVPEVRVRFVADWRLEVLPWQSERRGEAVALPPWEASCELLALSARGRTRAEAVMRLEQLLTLHESEGPAGSGVCNRRLLPYPSLVEMGRSR